MALEALERDAEPGNPLDRVERIAEAHEWAFSRTDAREVTMDVSGGWSGMSISLSWRDEFEILHVAASLEAKVPPGRRDEVAKLLARINEQLLVGHFDLWHADGSLIFRNSLLLSGNAEANDAQCEALIRLAVETCERYFPAVHFVVWAGQPAGHALEAAMIDTWGEA
ncbi:YbjN domain-containing protein [Aestuariivirga sp.]|uniref:YbjN domain-containing protein n=1 Tax=Aestuariivirga sp. TaxID=2650926 RepID=UPI0025BB1A52|nr:YbjN domain-containing protein [Aestuariivirga sp.]MCA3554196.1 YbjN domain-containing protein [Aestuariivirga sp.]